jgi:hypothetical protein
MERVRVIALALELGPRNGRDLATPAVVEEAQVMAGDR